MTQYYNQQQYGTQQPQQQAAPYDWSTPLPDKPAPEHVLVPDGRYAFVVKSKNFTYWAQGKLAGYPKCELTLTVWNESGATTDIQVNLTLADSMIFIVRQFWRAVGENVQPNAPFAPPWGTIQGRQGWADISHRSYMSTKDNQQKTVNEVKRYIEPDGRPFPPMPQQHEQTQYEQQQQSDGTIPF